MSVLQIALAYANKQVRHTNQTRREASADARMAERSHIRPNHNPTMV